MKKLVVANLIVLAFLVGCGAGVVAQQYVVPPANAQQAVRWDYTCAESPVQGGKMPDFLKQFGAEGWEVVSVERGTLTCFKRQM